MRRIAVSLLSGGLDSCVASAFAKQQGCELYLLSIHYGQVMEKELNHAELISEVLQPRDHKIIQMSRFKEISTSSRTDSQLIEYDNALGEDKFDIPAAYPPGRDISFIFIASAWLESLMLKDVTNVDIGSIFLGTNFNDSKDFPDCRQDVYDMINRIFSISTKVSVQYNKQMKVETPLINLSKDKVVKLGIDLGAPLDKTWSCYEGKDLACGRCDPCKLRLWAFEQAGIEDPISYQAMPSLLEA